MAESERDLGGTAEGELGGKPRKARGGGVSTVHLVGNAPSPWGIFTRHHFPPTLTPALEPVGTHMGGR